MTRHRLQQARHQDRLQPDRGAVPAEVEQHIVHRARQEMIDQTEDEEGNEPQDERPRRRRRSAATGGLMERMGGLWDDYGPTDRDLVYFTLGPVSFEAKERELVAILGPNASGKSTLLRLVAGLEKPLSGRVEIDAEEASTLDLRARAKRVALVQQESELLFSLRVWEYVLQGRYPHGKRLRFALLCRKTNSSPPLNWDFACSIPPPRAA